MKLKNYKQKGFSILAVILVIVAIVVAIGIWALSGQTNTSNSSNGNVDVQALSLINDSAAIKSAYTSLIINGANPNNIVFIPNQASTVSAPNILDPTNGIGNPKVNSSIVNSGVNSFWVYNYNGGAPNTNVNKIIYVFGIKDTVCKRINYNLFGVSSIYISAVPVVNFSSGVTPSNPTVSGTPSFGPTATGATYGCFGNTTSPNNNIFYRVLV